MTIDDLKKVLNKLRGVDVELLIEEGCYDYFEDEGEFVFVVPLNASLSVAQLNTATRSKLIRDIQVFPQFIDGDIVFDYFVELSEPIEDLDMDEGLCDNCTKKQTAFLN